MADLQSIAGDLYGVPLGEFMTMRNEQFELARDDGQAELARQVKALRKPHAAAWALNVMCREHPDLIHDVIELGEDLREAQAASDGSTIRRLDLTRRQLIRKVIRAATDLAEQNGQSFTAAASDGMEQTLWAAMLDPDVAGAVLTGLLVAPITAGMEGAELDEVLAISDPTCRSPAPVRAKADEAAPSPQELEAAAKEVDDKKHSAGEAGRHADALSKTRKELHARLERLEEDRQELRQQLRSVEDHIADLEQDLKEADHDSRIADAAADKAHEELTRTLKVYEKLNGE